jgi:methyl-accepting chemotaxis protein
MKKIKSIILGILLVLPSMTWAAGEVEKELLKTQAATPDFIAAMKELKVAAKKIAEENGITDPNSVKADVLDYYNNQFEKEYEKKNGGTKYADLAAHISELSPNQIVAQHFYIGSNKNPLGSKHLLDKADDKSSYSQLHGKYHPTFRKLLEDNGLYDIFLVDTASGENVYTVYKELDFFDNFGTGTNSKSGLGEAYQKALKAKKGEVVESTVSKYGFSYDVLALFIGTPIYDGDKLEGVLLFQVNP